MPRTRSANSSGSISSEVVSRVSVIVPMLNEAGTLIAALERCRRTPTGELIVVDGGSTDGSVDLAKPFCDKVLSETGGLARQLNRGAAEAQGDVLFFPYVDTEFPADWFRQLQSALSDPSVVGGAFRLGFDSDAWRFRVIAAFANWRSALGVGPLGDQGLFVRRQVFEQLGGFREQVLLEDLDLVRRLRKQGRVRILRGAVRTSTRRWQQRGMIATTFKNWSYLANHLLGRHGHGRRAAYGAYRARR